MSGFESLDRSDGADNDNSFQMSVKSVRPVLSGSLCHDRFNFKLHLNFVPGKTELLDLLFEYRRCDNLQLRVGQFKTPLGRYRLQSILQLTTTNWSLVSRYFGAERQMGFALHNGYDVPAEWGYAFGVFSGVNARASHGLGIPLVYGKEITNPSDLSGDGGDAAFHPELFVRLSRSHPDMDLQADTDRLRGDFRYALTLSGAWDLDPERYYDFTARLHPECLIKYRGLSALLLGHVGWSEVGASSRNEPTMLGGMVQLAYRFNHRWEIAGRSSVVDFTNELKDDVRRYAGIVAYGSGEYDTWDEVVDPSNIHRKSEIAGGVNFYFIEHQLKIQNEIRWFEWDYARADLFVQSMFQLSF